MTVLELPQDILICVLNEWLDVDLKCLSQLDVAVGGSGLREGHWLPLLAGLPVPPFSNVCKLPISIRSFLVWMRDRRLKRKSVLVAMEAVNSLDGALPFTFTSVTEVAFDPDDDSTDPFGLKEFLSLFPNLSSIDFTDCPLTDHQLLVLLDVPLAQLRKLNISSCFDITPAAAAAVGRHISSTLESLSCDVLDDAAVRILAGCCQKLTEIDLSPGTEVSRMAILRLLSQNANLTAIKLHHCEDAGNIVLTNNGYVTSISLACPMVQKIWLELSDPVDYHVVLPMLIENCKFLQNVCVGAVHLSIFRSVDGDRFCDIHRINAINDDSDLLAVLKLPIRRFGVKELGEDDNDILRSPPIHRRVFHFLAKNGSTLDGVRILASTDIMPEDVQHFLSNCPNLTVLRLGGSLNSIIFDDEIIRCLPSQCPQLVALELNCCPANVSVHDGGVPQQRHDLLELRRLSLQPCSLGHDGRAVPEFMRGLRETFVNIEVLCGGLSHQQALQSVEIVHCCF